MFLYLHGFASGPSSSKARTFGEAFARLGLELVVPQLDEGDFEHLTLSGQRRLVERLLENAPRPHVLIGSSMGGYLALLHAQAHGADAVVAMAPAVDFARRLETRWGAEFERWRAAGTTQVEHYALGRKAPLSFDLMRDAPRHEPWPAVAAPVLVLQGRHDEVVPCEAVRRWADAQAQARMLVFEAGHELTEVSERLVEEATAFLAGIPAVAAAAPQLRKR